MGFRIDLTSDVPALFLLGKALALADVVEQVQVLADGDVVKEVEEQVHVLRALGQNFLLGGCIIILTISTLIDRVLTLMVRFCNEREKYNCYSHRQSCPSGLEVLRRKRSPPVPLFPCLPEIVKVG